jgi:hypothetical protein
MAIEIHLFSISLLRLEGSRISLKDYITRVIGSRVRLLLNLLYYNIFANLFTSEVQETDLAFLEKIQPRVSHLMNEKLLAHFSPEDVKKAAFSIDNLKEPGPDGLHAVFYKNF